MVVAVRPAFLGAHDLCLAACCRQRSATAPRLAADLNHHNHRHGAYRGTARPQPELSGSRAARAACDTSGTSDDSWSRVSTLSDSGFSVGGRRPRRNTLTIDGLDHNDEFTGATPTELSLEFVREFQVITNGWSVETAGQRAESDERHPGEYGVRPASFASPILRTNDRGGPCPATSVFHRFRVLRGGS
jgi:hypothetical protein